MRTLFPYLWKRRAHFTEIWWVVSDLVAMRFMQFRCLRSQKPLNLYLKPHQKQTSLSRSLVHRQTWRLMFAIFAVLFHLAAPVPSTLHSWWTS